MDNKIYVASVVSTEDETMKGRIKIRVNHLHDNISDENLPYARQMMPSTSASYKENGLSPTWLEKGTGVICIPLDDNLQSFIIIGTFHKDDDINKLATNEKSGYIKNRDKSAIKTIRHFTGNWKEKLSKYSAKYPFNKVFKSSSGHTIEIDDTEDNERIVIYHASGSYIELNKDKEVNIKTGDIDIITDGDNNSFIKNNLKITIDGDANIDIGGTLTLKTNEEIKLESNKITLDSKTDVIIKAVNNIVHKSNQVHYLDN